MFRSRLDGVLISEVHLGGRNQLIPSCRSSNLFSQTMPFIATLSSYSILQCIKEKWRRTILATGIARSRNVCCKYHPTSSNPIHSVFVLFFGHGMLIWCCAMACLDVRAHCRLPFLQGREARERVAQGNHGEGQCHADGIWQ